MTTLITLIQYSFVSPHHSNQSSKINERNTNWKGRRKTIMFADNMLLYIENPKDSTKNLLAPTSEFDKVALYKIKPQKSLAFQHTNNKREKKFYFPLQQQQKIPRNKSYVFCCCNGMKLGLPWWFR